MIYSGTVQSKDLKSIPLFLSNHPMYSKYNIQPELDLFVKDINANFIIVIGLGAGYHVKQLTEKLPDSKIICIEADKESLDFCMQFECVLELKQNKNIFLCSLENLNDYIQLYLPAVYNNLTIVCYKSWERENQLITNKIISYINFFLEQLKADYSVQAHFGKIWNRNIFLNYTKIYNSKNIKNINTDLTAAIIAAGPTLDSNIKELKENNYFIISTDTAFNSLINNHIIPDCVISIDGQHISSTHFFNIPDSTKKIHFIFDLSSNPEAINKILKSEHSLEFIKNNHPLENILPYTENLFKIENGSGTVTIAACDWARQNGFSKLKFFGADFAYTSKPYAKGTYLDSNFSTEQSVFESLEKKHSALMYRTELSEVNENIFNKKIENKIYTSPSLKSYGETLVLWLKKYSYILKDNVFISSYSKPEEIKMNLTDEKLLKKSLQEFVKNTESLSVKNMDELLNDPYFYSLLPLIAWIKENQKVSTVNDLIKLAHNECLRYNYVYEK